MKSLGLIMLVENEAEFVADAIAAARPYVDSITVIDQESTDATPWILKSMKDVRYIWHRGNFAAHGEKYFRDLAPRLMREDWLLVIDADEILSDGWGQTIRPFLDANGDDYGAIETTFYNMVATYEYQALDSPRPCPRLVRNHRGLIGCDPMCGPFAHSFYQKNYAPDRVATVDGIASFHCGYVKADLFSKFERNIRRGDFPGDKAWQDSKLAEIRHDVLSGFGQCKPMDIPRAQYPSILRSRVGKTYRVKYDTATMRITERTVLNNGATKAFSEHVGV